MKYLILGTAALILMIPPTIIGIISFIWKPSKAGFYRGSRWLDVKCNYGKMIGNLLDEIKD